VENTLQLRTMSLSMPVGELCVSVDGTVNGAALDWQLVNFTGEGRALEASNIINFIGNTMALLAGDGFYFSGAADTIGIAASFFQPSVAGGCALCAEATLSVSRRLRFDHTAFVANAGTTSLSVQSTNIAPSEGYVLEVCNFGGPGTYLDGLDYIDDKSRFLENRGIQNSTRAGEIYWSGNATATTIAATSTFVKAAGTSTASPLNQRFGHTVDGRLTYISALVETFIATATLTLSAGNANEIEVAFYLNGTTQLGPSQTVTANSAGRVENVFIQTIFSLSQNDYVEVWVANTSATTDITVVALDMIVRQI
jgi:hypothetical protein